MVLTFLVISITVEINYELMSGAAVVQTGSNNVCYYT